MKILVTGGAGFIGSNVVDGYIEAGHEVLVVDDLSTGRQENINPRARFFGLDIRSEDLTGLIEEERPTVINHHAAQASVPVSVSYPGFDADVNIQGFLNILESAVKSKVKKVIFISSGGAVYGEAPEYPTPEDVLPRPLSPYAVSKYASELYLNYYRHQYGLEYTILRYANIYGPRQVPHGEAGVVAIFMDNLIAGRPSVLNHYEEDPEGMIRDYCYVGDVVAANLCALERGAGGTFNIATERGTRTLPLFKTILELFLEAGYTVTGEVSEPIRKPARPGDITRSCLVIDEARKILGWEPDVDLREGIRKTLSWNLAGNREDL